MTTTVGQVRFEHHRESLGIGESQPRISWTVQTDRDAWAQQAYEIQVVEPGGRDTDAESTGRVASAESVLVPWPVEPMGSRTRRLVRVRVWGNGGDGPSEWSEPAAVETGLLRSTDWTAQLISPSWPEDTSVDQPPALFRCEFDASADLVSARLYVTAHGVFEVELNGSVVGEDVLAPGWSSYRHRLRYHTYDVTELLEPGANAIGATVAEGWYPGPARASRAAYATSTATGSRCSPSWRSATPTARVQTVNTDDGLARPHWPDPRLRPLRGGDVRRPPGAGRLVSTRVRRRAAGPASRAEPAATDILVAPPGPPVRRIEELAPVAMPTSPSRRDASSTSVRTSSAGCVSGVARRGRARRSPCATPRCSSTASSAPGRCGCAQATDRYILARRRARRGSRASPSTASGTPRSSGWPGELTTDDLRAVVLHTDMERTGWFDLLRRADQPAARERRVGHARQLLRRAHRLPATRRTARLDRRHPGLRPYRRDSCTTAPACSTPGSPTSPPSRKNWARCRSTCRSSPWPSRPCRPPPGVMPR